MMQTPLSLGQVLFDPALPWPVIAGLAALLLLVTLVGAWRGLKGWAWRFLAGLVVMAGLVNPALQSETRAPLSDIVIAVVDESASQTIANRPAQTAAALSRLEAEIARLPDTELRVVRMGDAPDNGGSLLMSTLSQALAEEPQGRVAGMVMITDGRVHDLPRLPPLPAPAHVLLTGEDSDWDRRLIVDNAPAFAIMGEEMTLGLRIVDEGAAPGDTTAPLRISIDGGPPMGFTIPVGEPMELPLVLPHGGANVIEFITPLAEGELTDRNNRVVVQINGLRDRLRVLLVSGEPNPGERTWRNLLKSDPAVDLVHFTILRPPEKQDGIPVEEMSLIAFPTHELFVEKIEEFDLIVFDRYRSRGILPPEYLQNIANFIRGGGALLVSGGPEYADADSIFRTPLGVALPGMPSAQVLEQGFTPMLSDIGRRHPVTEGLEDLAPAPPTDGIPGWGRWFRLIDVTPTPTAEVVMEGPEGRPLLLLDRIGRGRVALIASDHTWLWDRGFEGGGPQRELLRRLAHWLMQEPNLEEEALWVEPSGLQMNIIRRTLQDSVPDVTITHPDGREEVVTLPQTSPGRYELLWEAPEIGLYRLSDGIEETVIALGPASPREFDATIASGAELAPALAPTGGAVTRIAEGLPALRHVREGRPATGNGWIGITPREAYATLDVQVTRLLPVWLTCLLALAFMLAGWLREGRRGSPPRM